ncbi:MULTISPECIES: hypothetical protein [unclassified Nocardioides]|uniref:hypothetical protein n=1 Tax=unclassified Nocardioides TaxID=2615069 RepID=UPI000ABF8FE1|nr:MULTISPECIES: hypothetical protein [unclassified Nocardioides]
MSTIREVSARLPGFDQHAAELVDGLDTVRNDEGRVLNAAGLRDLEEVAEGLQR